MGLLIDLCAQAPFKGLTTCHRELLFVLSGDKAFFPVTGSPDCARGTPFLRQYPHERDVGGSMVNMHLSAGEELSLLGAKATVPGHCGPSTPKISVHAENPSDC